MTICCQTDEWRAGGVRMKDKLKKFGFKIGSEVIVSLITAAILAFVNWFIEIAPTVGNSIFKTTSNVLYSLAATYSDSFILRIILLGGFGFLVGSVLKGIIDSLKMYKSIIYIEKEREKYNDEMQSEIIQKAFQKAQVKLNEVDDKEKFKFIVDKGKKDGKIALGFLALIVFIYVFISFFVMTPMNLSNKFSRDITSIAPYVEEQDIKLLQSDWVCMRSKADYDEIYKIIDNIKETYKLPD